MTEKEEILDYLDEELMEGSSTTQRYYERAVEYKNLFYNFSNFLIFLLMVCIIQLIISIWNARYIEISIFLVIGAICYYYIKKYSGYSDNDWREMSTRKYFLNREINSDDYEWVVGCCNKHPELKGFLNKRSTDSSQLNEKELRLFWLEFCRIETVLDESSKKEILEKNRNLLLKTIEYERKIK